MSLKYGVLSSLGLGFNGCSAVPWDCWDLGRRRPEFAEPANKGIMDIHSV